jgi:type IV pilus assembly protein PilZ
MAKKDRRRERKSVSVERRARERRQAERIPVDMEVDYECEETYLYAYITDIGALGIFLRTNAPYVVGTRLNLSFQPAGESTPLRLHGEVRWVSNPASEPTRPPGMGVAFLELTPEQRQRLLDLVQRISYLEENGSTTKAPPK